MAKRVAQVDIKITGLNSVKALEQELENINKQMSNLDSSTEEFQNLSNKANTATQKLKGINSELNGFTAQQKTESIKKVGEGLVGAFQLAQGASALFGEKTSEEMIKVIGKIQGVYAAVDGLDKISRVFSVENIKGLKAVGVGFKGLVTSVRAGSTAMKAALISTGIGALVVAVGLLIANWDKLTNLVSSNKKKKALEEDLVITERIKAVWDETAKASSAVAEIEKQLSEISGKRADYAYAEKVAQQQKGIALAVEKSRLQNLLAIQQSILDTNGKGSKKWEEANKEVGILTSQIKEQDALIKQSSERFIRAYQYLRLAPTLEKNNEALRKTINLLTEIQGEELNREDIYIKQKAILQNQIDTLTTYKKDWVGLTNIQQDELDVLNSQLSALNSQEEIRIRDTKIAIEKLNNEEAYTKELNRQKDFIEESLRIYDMISQDVEKDTTNAKAKLAYVEAESKLYSDIAEMRNAIVNFDKKGQEIFNKYYNENKELYQTEVKRLGIQDMFNKLTDKQQRTYGEQLLTIKNTNDAKLKQYDTELKGNDVLLKNLDEQKNRQQDIANTAQKRIDVEVIKRDKIQTLLNKGNLTVEKELDLRNKLKEKQDIINAAVTTRVEAEKEINNVVLKQNDILQTNSEIQSDIAVTTKETAVETTKITAELEKQATFAERAKNFTEQYAEEIQAGLDVMNAGFEFASALQDRVAKKAQERIKKADKELDRLTKKQEKSADRLKELQEQLKDADGERYNELLNLIKAEQDANIENGKTTEQLIKDETNAKLRAQFLIDTAEWNNAKLQKVQALINAVIQGALAVVKALPNIPLAIASGVLSAAAVATIAVQPLAPKPAEPTYLAKGGLLKGKSHAEGGEIIEAEGQEYVVNKHSTRMYLPLLEAINEQGNRKFAQGGLTAPVTTSVQQAFIDYDKLAQAVLSGIQPRVAVVDIVTGINKVKLIQANATL